MRDSVQSFYEEEAETYDVERFESKIGKLIGRIQNEIVLDFIQSELGDLILDVGSGTGRFVTELASKGATVIGLDASKSMLRKAMDRARRCKMLARTNFVLADAHNIPIRRASCHFCISINVINHIPNYELVLKEIAGVLRTSCHFVVNFPYAQGLLFPVAIIIRRTKRALFKEVYSNWFTWGEIRIAISKADLEMEHVQGFLISELPLSRFQSNIIFRILTILNSLFRYSFLKFVSGVLFIKSRKL